MVLFAGASVIPSISGRTSKITGVKTVISSSDHRINTGKKPVAVADMGKNGGESRGIFYLENERGMMQQNIRKYNPTSLDGYVILEKLQSSTVLVVIE